MDSHVTFISYHDLIYFFFFYCTHQSDPVIILFRYEVGDWVKFRRSITNPAYGWQGARQKSVGFVQNVLDDDSLIVSFCTGEARVFTNEVIKVIPLNRGQHVQLKPDVKEPRYGTWNLLLVLSDDAKLYIYSVLSTLSVFSLPHFLSHAV